MIVFNRACSLSRLEAEQTHQVKILIHPRAQWAVYIFRPVFVPTLRSSWKHSPHAYLRIRPSRQCISISPSVKCIRSSDTTLIYIYPIPAYRMLNVIVLTKNSLLLDQEQQLTQSMWQWSSTNCWSAVPVDSIVLKSQMMTLCRKYFKTNS